jgi:DNA mismatch endonuclease (patch repair protein)
MSKIKSKNTKLEMIVREYLFSHGLRYRIHYKVQGRPDIAFPKYKIAIFINGCFWHQHGCRLSVIPKTRTDFWQKKLSANRERDLKVQGFLTSEDWVVITLWECDLTTSTTLTLENLGKKIIDRIVSLHDSS